MLKHKSVTFAHDSGCAKENDFRANLRTDRFNRCATLYNPRAAARSKAKTSSFSDKKFFFEKKSFFFRKVFFYKKVFYKGFLRKVF